jgi:predicted transcriptional regulator
VYQECYVITAKDIMNGNVVTVTPDCSIEEAITTMIRLGISGLPVVDTGGHLAGIITEYDMLDIIRDPHTEDDKVHHYMTRDLHAVNEDDQLLDIIEMFQTLPVRRLMVVRGRKITGIISRRDILWIILKLRHKVLELQKTHL